MQVSTGAADKFPDVKVLLSHAGGFMPFIASRMAMGIKAVQQNGLEGAAVSERDIALLQNFYIDTALSGEPLCDHASMHIDVLLGSWQPLFARVHVIY